MNRMAKLAGVIILAAGMPLAAQVVISGQVNYQGNSVPYAPVQICIVTSVGTPCVPTALIYSDYNLAHSVANPNAADGNGNYTFYAANLPNPSFYIVQVTPIQGTTWSYVVGAQPAGIPNSQINVMAPPYNAKGDCVTDDSAAIQAALNVQLTSTPQITVYFPAPPGGCYLTSTLTYTGASLQGQAGAGFVGQPGAGVILLGKPSQDVLHIPDPTTVGSVNPRTGWAIRDMVIKVDDSVDASASFPHRWPGKWVQDGAINSSSNQFTSTKAEFTCGDTGQNILVKGAGAGGTDLSTTISSVSPCWNNGTTHITATATTVTLAANASTSVTNAYAYITPANIPVTQTLGNCGLAADNYDGNSADWVMMGGASTFQPSLWNVTFTSLHQTNSHNECAIYFGATWVPYMMDAKNVWVWNMNWGIVEGLVDTNPTLGVAGQDYQKWDHGWLYAKFPWISYNNGLLDWEDYQLTAANGPQILQVEGSNEGAPAGWYIHVPEFESATNAGWRIDGYQATVVQTELCDGRTASINTINSRMVNSNCGGTLDFNGSNNVIEGANIPNSTIVNNGMDNIYNGAQHQGSSKMVVTTPQTQTLNRGQQAWGTMTPDFVRNGTDPYYSDHDLFIWPEDFTDIYGFNFPVVADATSPTGNYAEIPVGGYDLLYYNNMYMLGRSSSANQIVAGTATLPGNIPDGPIIVQFLYKCPSITSFNVTVKAYGGGTTVGGPTSLNCSTSYATASIIADFTSYTGQAFDLNLSAGEVDIAYMAVEPLGNVQAANVTTPLVTFATGVTCDWAKTLPDLLTCAANSDSNSSIAIKSASGGSAVVVGGTAASISTSGNAINLNTTTSTFTNQVQMPAITGHGTKGPACVDASGNLYVSTNNTGTGAPCP